MSTKRTPSPWRVVLIVVGALVGLFATLLVAGLILFAVAWDGIEPSLEHGCLDSEEPMVAAAAEGDHDAVARALDGGDGPDLTDEAGNSPLACAGPAGHVAVVQLLLEAGADPDTIARDDDAVVADAVAFCQTDVLQLLLDAGADADGGPDDPERSATVPLADALERGEADAVLLLLDAGADPDAFRSPAIDLPAQESTSQCPEPTDRRRDAALALVLAGGADADGVLGYAAAQGWPDSVAAALDAGADPDGPEADSPLLHAVERGAPDVVDLLIDAGADVDHGIAGPSDPTDAGSLAALACLARQEDLTASACDPIAGVLAAAEPGEDPFATLDEQLGPDADRARTPLLQATWDGDLALVERLLAADADPDGASALGVVPLHAVAVTGDLAIAGALADAGATGPVGGPAVPSDLAEGAGNEAVARLLRDLGA
ncbi:MAG: hypothetical protein KDA98_03280 [Acidimicrobiales bacterium]|nr:hypothetical protein [Acidimicrobiales bacterium]